MSREQAWGADESQRKSRGLRKQKEEREKKSAATSASLLDEQMTSNNNSVKTRQSPSTTSIALSHSGRTSESSHGCRTTASYSSGEQSATNCTARGMISRVLSGGKVRRSFMGLYRSSAANQRRRGKGGLTKCSRAGRPASSTAAQQRTIRSTRRPKQGGSRIAQEPRREGACRRRR